MTAGWSWPLMLTIASGTLISEDGAAIFAGPYCQGKLTITPALLAVFIGIWLGDLGLYGLGRLLRPLAERWSWAKRSSLTPSGAPKHGNQRGWQAIAVSRLLPASRLPTYLAAGLLRMNIRAAAWTAIAVAIWTPAIVLGSHQHFGPSGNLERPYR